MVRDLRLLGRRGVPGIRSARRARASIEVRNLVRWGRREGFVFRKGTRRPRPGDIALHGYDHTGIVTSVAADGTVFTVDANWSDTVSHHPQPPFSVNQYLRLPGKPRRG